MLHPRPALQRLPVFQQGIARDVYRLFVSDSVLLPVSPANKLIHTISRVVNTIDM